MALGRFEVVHLGGLTFGRATYQPGWRWSEHVGMVVSGVAAAAFADGRVVELRPGDHFDIPPEPKR